MDKVEDRSEKNVSVKKKKRKKRKKKTVEKPIEEVVQAPEEMQEVKKLVEKVEQEELSSSRATLHVHPKRKKRNRNRREKKDSFWSIQDFQNRYKSLHRSFLSHGLNVSVFDESHSYVGHSRHYTEGVLGLLSDLLVWFELQHPLLTGEHVGDVMLFLALGSYAGEMAVPLSDLELVVLLRKEEESYYLWVSEYLKKVEEVGIKLDIEYQHPAIFSEEGLVQKGSLFAIGTPLMMSSYYRADVFQGKHSESWIGDLTEKLSVGMQGLYQQSVYPVRSVQQSNGYSYIEDRTGQVIQNIAKNLLQHKQFYGNKELLEEWKELREARREEYEGLLFLHVQNNYSKFYHKHQEVSLTQGDLEKQYLGLYSWLKHRFYRPVQLVEMYMDVYCTQLAELGKGKLRTFLKPLKQYASYLRLRSMGILLEEGLGERETSKEAILKLMGYDKQSYKQNWKDLFDILHNLLRAAHIHPNLRKGA